MSDLKVNSVLKKALQTIKPKDDSVVKKAKEVIELISKSLRKQGIKASAFLGGSVAKNTYLANDYDCDVFVRFDYKEYKNKDNELSNILEDVLKNAGFDIIRIHGSRDYFQFYYNNVKFEIVPVLKIEKPEQALNIMDVSPLHVLWFKKHSNTRICDSVRLMKVFCKAQGVYGAESFIRGFSGHVIDILIVYYGSFTKLLRSIVNDWKEKILRGEKVVVDVENFHKGRALFNINKSKTQGPLVVVDPVQPSRNAAAALSMEKTLTLIRAAENFLKKPSLDFFVIKEYDEDKIINELIAKAKKKASSLFILRLKPKKDALKKLTRLSVDIVGSKLLKGLEFLNNQLKNNDFIVEDYGFEWDKKLDSNILFYFIIKNPMLGPERIIRGPSITLTSAVLDFKKKHKKTMIKGKYVIAVEKRRFRSAKALIKHLIKQPYFTERTKYYSISFDTFL